MTVPLIPRSGPEASSAQWKRFVDDYTNHGEFSANAENAALLHHLAFGGGAEQVVEECGRDETVLRRATQRVEEAALALSITTAAPGMQPLRKRVVGALIEQWIALEQGVGLYPPPLLALSQHVSRKDSSAVQCRYALLSRTPEAVLVRNTLRLVEDGVIRDAVRRAFKRAPRGVSFDEALAEASHLVDFAVIRFQRGDGAHFETFLNGSLNRYLPHRLRRLARNQQKAGGQLDEEVAHALPDGHCQDPSEEVADDELLGRLPQVLDSLPPQQRLVLDLRFGFADGVRHTLQDIGNRLGVTQERVRQLQAKALARCRLLLDGADAPTSPLRDLTRKHTRPMFGDDHGRGR